MPINVGEKTGTLYLVGTPIGNLGDITLRAIETLKNVDLIAAEDTRQTRKLLNHLEIEKPLTSYFEHNKLVKGPQLIAELQTGKNIALVSDAGMPGISDPGTELVQTCITNNIPTIVIPGPTALITGLVASGLSTDGFVFVGFFPRDKAAQKKLLDQLAREPRTLIFYESPHRLLTTLERLQEFLGDRRCCVARELTKIYEEYRRGTISELLASFSTGSIRGEIIIIVEGCKEEEGQGISFSWEEILNEVKVLREEGMSLGEASKIVAQKYGMRKREIYNYVSKEVE